MGTFTHSRVCGRAARHGEFNYVMKSLCPKGAALEKNWLQEPPPSWAHRVMMHMSSGNVTYPSKDVPWYLPAAEDHPQWLSTSW
jgi:hypothetical protein